MNINNKNARDWLVQSSRRSFYDVLQEAKITPRQMEIAELRFVKGLMNYQIAMQLNISTKTVEKEEEIKDIICAAVDKIKMYCPEEFRATVYKLHCVAFGPHFDESLAKKAVAKMRNVDGTVGEHWSMEQTNQLADQYGIKHKADWYYVINMLYSDFSQVIGSDAGNYAKLAKAYMQDPDAPEGKAFNVWLAQMK